MSASIPTHEKQSRSSDPKAFTASFILLHIVNLFSLLSATGEYLIHDIILRLPIALATFTRFDPAPISRNFRFSPSSADFHSATIWAQVPFLPTAYTSNCTMNCRNSLPPANLSSVSATVSKLFHVWGLCRHSTVITLCSRRHWRTTIPVFSVMTGAYCAPTSPAPVFSLRALS